jgi:nucleotide-binding universal stress UspA family protein
MIVVRGGERNRQGAFHRIVLGVGDAPGSSPAARFALSEAGVRGAELLAVRAWRRPSHKVTDHELVPGGLADQDKASSILDTALAGPEPDHGPADVHRQVVEGPAHAVLLDLAATADLLVVGARRRRRNFGLQLGQVNHAVLHHAACPVAVVPRQG